MADDEPRFVVKPKPGLLIRHPATMQAIAEDGEDLTTDAYRGYFHRMLRTGDVVLVPQGAPRPHPLKKED